MLEQYFVKPETIDRVRAAWIGPEIETYVSWLAEHRYGTKTIWRRVPIMVAFAEFARGRGALVVADLPAHLEAFVADRVAHHDARAGARRRMAAKEIRGPVEQMLSVVLPGFEPSGRRCRPHPFADVAPRFFDYLVEERGLRPASVQQYRFHLDRFEAYLQRVGLEHLEALSPALLSAFVVERAGSGLARSTVRDSCGVLRVFLRYAHREGVLPADVSNAIGWPQVYRLSTIPRSISWEDVNRVLAGVDRRTPVGRRDYAILLLLVTYGLRGREVAALTLDDIDWKRERLAVPERKAGHSTAFPLSSVVGAALVAYLQQGRPETTDRHVFFPGACPCSPDRISRGVGAGRSLPAQGRHRRSPPGLAHDAPLGRSAPGGRRLRSEDDR